jgi:hypothetical protein
MGPNRMPFILAAYAPAIMALIDLPAIATGEIPDPCKASSTKTCLIPRASPLPSAIATLA